MKCPNCGLEVSPDTIECECGFNVATQTMGKARPTGRKALSDGEKAVIAIVAIVLGTAAVFGGAVLWDSLKVKYPKPTPMAHRPPERLVRSSPPTAAAVDNRWCKPASRFWTGLELYSGNPKAGRLAKYAVVIGGDSKDVLVRFLDSGSVEWKSLDPLGFADWSWCRCDDPAINAQRWQVLHNQ